MIETLITICLIMPVGFEPNDPPAECRRHGAAPMIAVRTDNNPAHWRRWRVLPNWGLARWERCSARIDARRFLLKRPLTRRVPKVCSFGPDYQPDPHPSAL